MPRLLHTATFNTLCLETYVILSLIRILRKIFTVEFLFSIIDIVLTSKIGKIN